MVKQWELAILSGLLIAFSFPLLFFGWRFPDLSWFAWFGFVPLFVTLSDAPAKRTFLLSLVTMIVLFSISLSWLYNALHEFGKLSVGLSLLLMLLLVLFYAAYLSFAPLAAHLIARRRQGEILIWMPVCWTAVELLRNSFCFDGFPWSHIAMSQFRSTTIIQIADIVGVYGLVFLIIWINQFLADGVLRLQGKRDERFLPKTILTIILVLATLGYGVVRQNEIQGEMVRAQTMKIGLIQGNIPQDVKWSAAAKDQIVRVYAAEAKKLADAGVDLIIWPEASLPYTIPLLRSSLPPTFLGGPFSQQGDRPLTLLGVVTQDPEDRYYNSALLFNAQGEKLLHYHKSHLVPFGEYVPYQSLLFFAKKLAGPIGEFFAGDGSLPMGLQNVSLAPLICYEDIFPEISRDFVLRGADLLINITNDAWYGLSAAAEQHLALSTFRAVENRRAFVRSTNTGVSAVIDPTGKIMNESPLFERLVQVGVVPLMKLKTSYTKWGDWFAWGCVAYVIFGFGYLVITRRRKYE